MVEMVNAYADKNLEKAQNISARLSNLVPLMFCQSNPIPVKTAVAAQGLVAENFRLPLCKMSTSDKNDLLHALTADGWLEGATHA